ncbi:MAG: LysM peptidoglycan-binding domain-containing protein [Rhodanobacter sp.]
MGNETNKPDFSDVQGGVQSTAKDAPEAKPDFSDVQSKVTSTADEATIYEVKSGENLSGIAKHFYGNANEWKTIFEANRDQLSDPDRIKPGQMLKIPTKS